MRRRQLDLGGYGKERNVMPKVIELTGKRQAPKKLPLEHEVDNAIAEVIIFPGVRYEHVDAESHPDPALLRR